MQKTENPILLAVILCLITGITALLLAFSNNLTKDKIAELANREQQIALESVISAKHYTEIEFTDETGTVKKVYKAFEGDVLNGYCVNVAPNGFGGEIDMMVGIDTENKVTGVKIISMSETAGLGSKAQRPEFTEQFKGKQVQNANKLNIIKSGTPENNDIVAITGATVTSAAVKDGVNTACAIVEGIKGEIK